MEKKQESDVVITEADVDWSYGVLSAVRESMDKAVDNPELSKQLMREIAEGVPDLLEAVLILVKDEHRGVVGSVIASAVRWSKTWVTIK